MLFSGKKEKEKELQMSCSYVWVRVGENMVDEIKMNDEYYDPKMSWMLMML